MCIDAAAYLYLPDGRVWNSVIYTVARRFVVVVVVVIRWRHKSGRVCVHTFHPTSQLSAFQVAFALSVCVYTVRRFLVVVVSSNDSNHVDDGLVNGLPRQLASHSQPVLQASHPPTSPRVTLARAQRKHTFPDKAIQAAAPATNAKASHHMAWRSQPTSECI